MDVGDAQAASRTLLELVATLMEASFQAVGEGAILGTMPAYLERFGHQNAVWMNRHFVKCHAEEGAVSALTPMNYVSRVTKTPFEMPKATKNEAVKRLKVCEFQDAFEGRGDFPKAMMCLLHKAAYQGSVNGTLGEGDPGYRVDLQSRILFGDDHCDFAVTSRTDRGAGGDKECKGKDLPSEEELAWLSYGFYTFLLTSFVDYLTKHLGQAHVEQILRDCANKVGGKVYALMDAVGLLPDDGPGAAAAVLRIGGRTFVQEGDAVTVTACPQAEHIRATSAPNTPEDRERVRANACRLCKNLVAGAVDQVCPGAKVTRTSALALGDDDCRFRVEVP